MDKKRKIHKSLIILTFIILILLCGCSDEKSEYEDKSQQIAKDTLNQLKLDYKEDFEIESITYTKENDSYVLFVHPKSEPDISFRVIKWAMGGNNLIDNYTMTRREYQTEKIFKPFAEKINKKYLLLAGLGQPMDPKEGDIMKTKDFYNMAYSTNDLLKKHNKKIRIVMLMFFFFDLNENNKEEVCKKVFEMVKYIQSLEVAEVDLSIQFYDEDFFRDKDVVKINEEEMGPAGMMNFQSNYAPKYKKVNIIFEEKTLKEFKKIKSYKDIERKIWYKEFTGEKDNVGGDEYKWVQK